MSNRHDKHKTIVPSINIWQAQVGFKVILANSTEIYIYKNELLFLLGIEQNFFVFKSENGKRFGLHKYAIDQEHIAKVFPDGM